MSEDLHGGSNSVSYVDRVSDMISTCWLFGSMQGFRKGTMTSAHLDARCFSFFLYVSGAFQAATPMLELRGGEIE